MITVEVRVNGTLISAANAVNSGDVSPAGLTLYEYQAVQFPMDIHALPTSSTGILRHRRDAGAEVLVSKLLMKLVGPNEK